MDPPLLGTLTTQYCSLSLSDTTRRKGAGWILASILDFVDYHFKIVVLVQITMDHSFSHPHMTCLSYTDSRFHYRSQANTTHHVVICSLLSSLCSALLPLLSGYKRLTPTILTPSPSSYSHVPFLFKFKIRDRPFQPVPVSSQPYRGYLYH